MSDDYKVKLIEIVDSLARHGIAEPASRTVRTAHEQRYLDRFRAFYRHMDDSVTDHTAPIEPGALGQQATQTE